LKISTVIEPVPSLVAAIQYPTKGYSSPICLSFCISPYVSLFASFRLSLPSVSFSLCSSLFSVLPSFSLLLSRWHYIPSIYSITSLSPTLCVFPFVSPRLSLFQILCISSVSHPLSLSLCLYPVLCPPCFISFCISALSFFPPIYPPPSPVSPLFVSSRFLFYCTLPCITVGRSVLCLRSCSLSLCVSSRSSFV
jgi:hypothetical protein